MHTREINQRTIELDAGPVSSDEFERRFGEGASTVVHALRECGVPLERVMKLYAWQENADDDDEEL